MGWSLQAIRPCRQGIAGKALTLISKYNSAQVFGAVCTHHDVCGLRVGSDLCAKDAEAWGGWSVSSSRGEDAAPHPEPIGRAELAPGLRGSYSARALFS